MKPLCFIALCVFGFACSPRYETVYIYRTKGSTVYYNSRFYEYSTGSGCIWAAYTGTCSRKADTLYFTPRPDTSVRLSDEEFKRIGNAVLNGTYVSTVANVDLTLKAGIGVIKSDTLYAFGAKYVYSGKTRKYDISPR